MINKLAFYLLTLVLVLHLGFSQRSKETNVDTSRVEPLSEEEIQELLDELDESFYILKDNYVDDINDLEIIKSGIKGLFKPLDPYTVFLEGSRKERLEMLTRGKYGGVGIQINTRRDTLIITGVMEDSPAYSEGLVIGDKIIMVDSTSTIGFTTKEVSALIKGEKGTEVTLGIYRPSTRRKYEYVLTRDQIVVKDVPYYGIDEDGIGYVRITKFSRYTARDFRVAMKSFSESDNLNGIVIDLRNNSGGLLRNALSILDNLVEKNTLLLSTRGRNKNSNSKKYARQNPIIDQDVPIAVLINKGSASASEIVAGTLQDLDRAVIMGEKSFGKGLVQSMFPINDSTKLKLTTAKYYTPSGRLIQKYDYLENGVLTDGLDKSDSTFYTLGGRKVKGGGGITPDITLSRNTIPPFVSGLWRQGLFLTFAATYVPSRDIQTPVVITNEIILNKEILSVLECAMDRIENKEIKMNISTPSALHIHARYSRDEILASFGVHTFNIKSSNREGVVDIQNLNTELLFVTLQKTEKRFSPTTLYHDYAINKELFHWQSQNSARPDRGKGLKYINHKKSGKTIILFVREQSIDEFGRTMGFVNLGPVYIESYNGSQPMNITWKLEQPLPSYLWREAVKLAVG